MYLKNVARETDSGHVKIDINMSKNLAKHFANYVQITKEYLEKLRPEKYFLVTTIIFGFVFMLLIPPFQTPDENIHLYRAYEVSELKISQKSGDGTGNYLPSSIRHTELITHGTAYPSVTPDQIAYNYNSKYDIHFTAAALLDIRTDTAERLFYQTGGAPQYNPLSYTLQALAILPLKILNAPIIVMIYAIRLMNLAIWVLCGYFAIKIIPIRKWTLAGVCLLPVIVAQAVSIGLDSMIFASVALFVAVLTRALVDSEYKISMKMQAVLTILATMMVIGKPVLAIVVGMTLLIKNKQFGANSFRGQLFMKISILAIPILITLGWMAITLGLADTSTNSSSSFQIERFIANPLIFPLMLASTIFLYSPASNILAQSLIGNFGWVDTPMSTLVVMAGAAYVTLLVVTGYEKLFLPKVYRIIMIGVALLYIVLVYFSMFIAFTKPTELAISGVQGRYLIPALMIIAVAIYGRKIVMKKKDYRKMVLLFSTLLLVVATFAIYARYYTVHFI